MSQQNNKKLQQLQNDEYFNVYKDFETTKESEALISFNQITASVLFKNNLGYDSQTYKDFSYLVTEAFKNKHELVFESFVISFNINPKYSTTTLVPILAKAQNSNTLAVSLKSAKDTSLSTFLVDYNQHINSLLAKQLPVEVLPNIIILNSAATNSTKLLFDKSITAKLA